MDSLTYGVILLALVSLAPAALFVIGKIKDPFNPLILMGTLSYFVGAHRLIVNRNAHFDYLPVEDYAMYVWVAFLCVVGIYVGWWRGRSAVVKEYTLSYWQSELQVNFMVLAAVVFTAIGFAVNFIVRGKNPLEFSGYLLDLEKLWIAGAILSVQIYFLCPQYRVFAGTLFILALVPPLDHFMGYGQRGDTYRIAAVLELFYLIQARRPTKPVFITAAIVLGLTLATLHMTRGIVAIGEASNRVSAIPMVIPKFFQQSDVKADPGDEDIFGTAAMRTVQATGTYGYGRSLTIGLVGRFLPRTWFPGKDAWVHFHGGYSDEGILSVTGMTIPGGSAVSGFAYGFFELGWFCPILWVLIGYSCRKLWDRAIAGDFRYQGIVIGFSIAILYAISQDLMTAEVNMIYVLLPLALIYRVSRTRSEVQLLPEPA